jgi:Putative restriction endonuclease
VSAIFEWATSDNLQPEPITVEIWRDLPEDFCRQVEVVDGQAVRRDSPARSHQKAAHRLMSMLESAAEQHMQRDQDSCLDVDLDFDVTLWDVPKATIRRPDIALYDCRPEEVRPLPAACIKVIVEIVSPGSTKVDTTDKMAEYARAGIPWYWLVRIAGNQVTSIDVHVLDHTVNSYRLHRILEADGGQVVMEVPIRIKIQWDRLTELTR